MPATTASSRNGCDTIHTTSGSKSASSSPGQLQPALVADMGPVLDDQYKPE